MSKTMKVAFWPDERMVGCANIQRHLNCDPYITTFFGDEFVTTSLLNGPVYVWEATAFEWRAMAEEWKRDPRATTSRVMSVQYH